jgi:hypothetical protein
MVGPQLVEAEFEIASDGLTGGVESKARRAHDLEIKRSDLPMSGRTACHAGTERPTPSRARNTTM